MVQDPKQNLNLNQEANLRTVPMCVHIITHNHVCAYHYTQQLYTIQQTTVLTIFPS